MTPGACVANPWRPSASVLALTANGEAFQAMERRRATDELGWCIVPVWREREVDLLLALCDETPLDSLCQTSTDVGRFLGDLGLLAYRGCIEPTEAGPAYTLHGLLTAERFIARREATAGAAR